MATPEHRFMQRLRGDNGLPPIPPGEAIISQRFQQNRPGPYRAGEREQKLVSDINTKLQRFANARFEFERVWFTNIAMFLGFHYHSFAERVARYLAPAVPRHRVRLVCNRILPIVQARVAKITRNRPVINVVPATSDDESMFKARACEKYLRYIEEPDITCMADESGVERSIMLAYWMQLCGTVFEQIEVDPNAGDYIEEPRVQVSRGTDPTGRPSILEVPITDPDTGKPVVDRYWTGDVKTTIRSAFDMYPEPGGDMMSNLGSFIIAYLVPIETARLRRPDLAAFIQPTGDWSMTRFFTRRLSGLVTLGRFASRGEEEESQVVLMKEYHEPPSTEYPKGRIVTLIGDVLDSEVTDPPLGWCNVVRHGDTYVPGRFWWETPITQLNPLQKGYNRGRSAVKEWKNLMANVKVVAAKGHGLEEVAYDGDSGEFLEYTPIAGAKEPYHMQPGEMPVGAFKDMDYDLEDIKFIGGVSDPSMGINPPNVESGLQLQYLAELDDSKFAPTIALFEKGKEKTALLQLEAARLVYDEPRSLTILGSDKRHEAFEFSRDMIPLKYSIRVQSGSALPYSLAARREFVMNLWDKGAVVNPHTGMPDVREFHRLLEFGDYEKFREEQLQDEKNAEMENRYLKLGDLQHIKLETFDDHGVHISTHNKARKQDWYRFLPPDHPMRLFFDDHVNRHQAIALALAVRAQMLTPPGMGADQGDNGGGGNGKSKPTSRAEQRQESSGGARGGRKSRVTKPRTGRGAREERPEAK